MNTFDVTNARKSFMLIALVVVKDGIPYPKRLTYEEWRLSTTRVLFSFQDLHDFSSEFVMDGRFMQYIKDLSFLELIDKAKGAYALTESGKLYVHDRYISNGIYMKERKDPEEVC